MQKWEYKKDRSVLNDERELNKADGEGWAIVANSFDDYGGAHAFS